MQAAIERSRIDTLATGAWIRSADRVLMQGPPGGGRARFCVGLRVKAVQLGLSVICYRVDALMATLRVHAALPPAGASRGPGGVGPRLSESAGRAQDQSDQGGL